MDPREPPARPPGPRIVPGPLLPLGLLAGLLLATATAAAEPLVHPGPFGPTAVTLADGRVVTVPAETHAFYRMLTQDGRIHGRNGPGPSDQEVEEGIRLRRRHEPRWAARFARHSPAPGSAWVFPVDGGALAERPGYRPGHEAEDIFAPAGRRVLAPAAMLVVHAGYLSRTAGEAAVGFIPSGPAHPRARYVVLVHLDAGPARAALGRVVAPGTLLGFIAEGDEAVVGNALGRPPHLHFVVREEQPDGRLRGIPVWDLLRRATRPGPWTPRAAGVRESRE